MANIPGPNKGANLDWMRASGIGSGLGTALGGLFGLFGGNGSNPTDAAMPYFNQIPGLQKNYYNPYIQAGQRAGGINEGLYGQMAQHPGDYYNQIGAGYKESPGYQFRLKQGLEAANNAAAAGGMAGSLQHQQQSSQIANDIAAQDFNDYLNHVLGINQTGLAGNEMALGRGYNASSELGNNLSSNLAQQGKLAYEGKNYENQNEKSGLESLFSGLGSALPFLWF